MDLAHAVTLLRFLILKIKLNLAVDVAYASRDAVALAKVGRQLRLVLRALDQLHASFRRQWFRRNKPQGFETTQIRLGGQRQRWLEFATRLEDLAAGRCESIPELDEVPGKAIDRLSGEWAQLASVGIL